MAERIPRFEERKKSCFFIVLRSIPYPANKPVLPLQGWQHPILPLENVEIDRGCTNYAFILANSKKFAMRPLSIDFSIRGTAL